MLDQRFLRRDRLQTLLDALKQSGYRCVGPQVRDGAIVYDTLERVEDLPQGVRDVQGPGHYRIERDGGQRLFAWANGPQALKPLVFTPREALWRSQRDANGILEFSEVTPEAEPVAVIGARACDLAALYIQNQHFLREPLSDPYYTARQRKLFLVAVHCSDPADTCFCASTGDGPRATYGFDLALGELDDGFVVEARSAKGLELLGKLPVSPASDQQIDGVDRQTRHAAEVQTRRLPSRNLRDQLFNNLNHPRWLEVAERCLSCGNCTLVCPTCFCHSEADQLSLDGARVEHYRQWDSCFTQGHSYIHGLVIRSDTRLRYRQWLTHKLGSWHDQYGRSGCVGCGRCITWCPVGIDITEEATAICAEADHG